MMIDLAGRLGREVARRLEPDLRACGMVSLLELRVCGVILDLGPMRPIDVARFLRVPVSTVSELSERLVQAEILSRKRNPKDRRSVVLAPTEHTGEVVRILREAATGWLQGLLVGLDDAALADLARGLAQIPLS